VNILTKIFIVLMVPLSVLAGSVFATHALADKSYRQRMEEEIGLRKVAEDARNASSAVAKSLGTENTRLRGDNADLRASEQRLLEDLALLSRTSEKDKDTLKSNYDELNIAYESVGNQLADSQQESRDIREQLKAALDAEDRAKREAAETLAVLHDTQTELATAKATSRVYEEQIAMLKQRLAAVNTATVVTDAPDSAMVSVDTPDVTTKISTKITGVSDGIASIDAGTVKGIRKGMTLYIYRGPQFVAHMEVLTVDDSEASGRIYDRAEGKEPQVGDVASTSLD
jgi:hypothetical protein